MAPLRTYLSRLYEAAHLHPLRPAIHVPESTSPSSAWRSISYSELISTLEAFARYWAQQLSGRNVAERSTVAVWTMGSTYLDFLTIWGVARAGFIPHLISFRLTDPTVVREMMASYGTTALVHDPSVNNTIVFSHPKGEDVPIFSFPIVDVKASSVAHLPLPDMWIPSTGKDVMIVYSTSGSSKGIPKPVPLTASWFENMLEKGFIMSERGGAPEKRTVTNLIGSMAHFGSLCTFVDVACYHGEIVIPRQLPFGSSEIQAMIEDTGITLLHIFTSFHAKVLADARQNPALLASLQKVELIRHAGLAMDPKLEAWGANQGLRIVNTFASTEAGVMLKFEPRPGGSTEDIIYQLEHPASRYEFIPLEGAGAEEETVAELVILPESPDCPHPSLRDPTTGKFHTGDLFLEVELGRYIARGRVDDWIKMERSLRCDTGSLEANAMETCGEDLVTQVAVCGVARPCPVMLVELKGDGTGEQPPPSPSEALLLQREVLRRISPFHQRRYDHERITNEHLIVVVPQGSLPRTAKGNVQRKITEVKFADKISQAYQKANVKSMLG